MANETQSADHLLTIEEWRAICVPGFSHLYEVSSLGRIRSLHFVKPRIRAVHPNGDGYPTVCLWNGRRRTFRVHKLVAMAFHGPGNILHNEVAHLDGDRANPRAANLQWVSKVENHSHKVGHGTLLAGERHPGAKLTNDEVREMKRRLLAGEAWSELARHYQISGGAVRDIARGKNWDSVGPRLRLKGAVGCSLPGQSNPGAKFTNAQAEEIRRRSQAGEPYSKLAAAYRVTKGTICRIVTGTAYRKTRGPNTISVTV